MTESNEQPFFSILIPSYNRPSEICKNIDSILANSFSDYEIVISDDCSPRRDEIFEVVTPYLKNSKIKYYQQDLNLREPNNKNVLVSKATGKYNILLGDDDEFLPDSLLVLHTYIKENPDFDLYSFGYNIVDENNRLIRSHKSIRSMELDITSYCGEELLHGDVLPLWIFHPATFCCKRGLELDLTYQTDVGMAEDMWFIFECLLRSKKIFVIPEILFNWRKIQNVTVGVQANQSTEYLADFNARKAIYTKLLNHERVIALPQSVTDYLRSLAYRKRFLYDAVVSDRRISRDADLGLDDKFMAEFSAYTEGYRLYLRRYSNYFKRAFLFLSYVGIKDGVCFLLNGAWQRVRYRIVGALVR